MEGLIDYLFGAASFLPHGVCLLWRPDLVALHGSADMLISVAYLTIPMLIADFARRRPDLVEVRVAWMFVAFITACALSHLMGLLTLWYPYYGLHGLVKAATAAVSIYTAWQLWMLRPYLLGLPSSARLAEAEFHRGEAEQSNRKLSDFANIAAHDLRAPLRALRIVPDWLREDLAELGVDTPEIREHLDTMQVQSRRMDNLVTGLLEYSKIGQDGAKAEPVEVGDVVADVIDLLAAGTGLRIVTEGEMPVLPARRAEVELIFRNLISNAIKYHDRDSGTVIVRAVGPRDGAFLFEVEDDGPGIPENKLEAVFDQFARLVSNDDIEGTGLGLAAVRRAAEANGGRAWARNVVGGRGAIFSVTIGIENDVPD